METLEGFTRTEGLVNHWSGAEITGLRREERGSSPDPPGGLTLLTVSHLSSLLSLLLDSFAPCVVTDSAVSEAEADSAQLTAHLSLSLSVKSIPADVLGACWPWPDVC